ncbi:MAG: helix-turn-helix domain-containing protein [Bacteroidales bacterium]
MEHCKTCREPLENVMERLKRVEIILEHKQQSSPDQVFFDNQEFIQVMNISKRTAQAWRDAGIIAYSQIGCKMYYRLTDILALLEKHHKPAKT